MSMTTEQLLQHGIKTKVSTGGDYATDFGETEIIIGQTYYEHEEDSEIFPDIESAIQYIEFKMGNAKHPYQI